MLQTTAQGSFSAKLSSSNHPPVKQAYLRHACGYYLASQDHDTRAIQDYLGHRNIQHTVRYTRLSSNRFDNFWLD